MTHASPLGPRLRVGILGAGQLGLMLGDSITALGGDVVHYEASPAAPALRRTAETHHGAFDDAAAIQRFARTVDVLTYEFENVGTAGLLPIPDLPPVRPSLHVLDVACHRVREKQFLQAAGVDIARFHPVAGARVLAASVRTFGMPCIAKTVLGGYDGKGQFLLKSDADVANCEAALLAAGLDHVPLVLEEALDIETEVSVIVARSADGQTAVMPVLENMHTRHILDISVLPARVPTAVADAAEQAARRVAEALGLVGLLTVEFFIAHRNGQPGVQRGASEPVLLVNEIAPRPHNSGHVTRAACDLSQFDLLARVLMDVPLRAPALIGAPAHAMVNLLGDCFTADGAFPYAAIAARPDVHEIYVYGKGAPRPGRKMGHVIVSAPTADAAVRAAREVHDAVRAAVGTTATSGAGAP